MARRIAAGLLAAALVVGLARVDWIALAYEPALTEASFAADRPDLPLAFDLVLTKRRPWFPGPDYWHRPITRQEFVLLSAHRTPHRSKGSPWKLAGRSSHLVFDLMGPEFPGLGPSPEELEATLDHFAARE